MNKNLETKMDELAIQHNEALRYFENASFDAVYKNGFQACHDLMIEDMKKLAEALDRIDVIYRNEMGPASEIAWQTLQEYKSK